MDREPAPQIGQSEGALAVAAIRGSDKVEEGFVFGNREQLPLAEHPACRSKIAREDTYLTDVGLAHGQVPPSDFLTVVAGYKKTAYH
jgi:hypothetical protein